ncbi:hypothetical protein O0I39_11295, partial [Staphylococcus pseudintermedius]|nr:hypothetical protein [Staphylococcus pseudintermedius]MDF0034561.1 hypothetical protein [Staphylococcus pseudintermedius]MDF0046885.1 hypothetical protein [Staphylococcus pseudintermedius]MDK3940605.1 hypothetical protein [Staphylococcus pseudintermedius]
CQVISKASKQSLLFRGFFCIFSLFRNETLCQIGLMRKTKRLSKIVLLNLFVLEVVRKGFVHKIK